MAREVEPRAEEEADAAEEDAASASAPEEEGSPDRWRQTASISADGDRGVVAGWPSGAFLSSGSGREPLSCVRFGSRFDSPVETWERERGCVEAAWELPRPAELAVGVNFLGKLLPSTA